MHSWTMCEIQVEKEMFLENLFAKNHNLSYRMMVNFYFEKPCKNVLKNGEMKLFWKMNLKDLKLHQNE